MCNAREGIFNSVRYEKMTVARDDYPEFSVVTMRIPGGSGSKKYGTFIVSPEGFLEVIDTFHRHSAGAEAYHLSVHRTV